MRAWIKHVLFFVIKILWFLLRIIYILSQDWLFSMGKFKVIIVMFVFFEKLKENNTH